MRLESASNGDDRFSTGRALRAASVAAAIVWATEFAASRAAGGAAAWQTWATAAGLAAVGGLLASFLVEALSAVMSTAERFAGRRTVEASAAIVVAAAIGLAAAPFFTGPRARLLLGAALIPWGCGALLAAAWLLLRRLSHGRRRAAASVLVLVAAASVTLDARLFPGLYERFHLLAAAGAWVIAAWGGRLLMTQVEGGSVRRRATIAVLLLALGAGAMTHAARRPAIAAELARCTAGLWRMASWLPAAGDSSAAPVDFADDFVERAEREHGAAVHPSDTATRPPILLITVDALRADRAPGTPLGDELMPRTAAALADGFRFTRAYAPTVTSWPSCRSILTGTYPDTFLGSQPLPPTFCARLKELGYRTAFLSGIDILERGRKRWMPALDHDIDRVTAGHPTPALVKSVLEEVKRGGSWFVWIHACEVHHPYRPPQEYVRSPGSLAAYEGGVRWMDALLAPLWDGLPKDVRVIFASDHGEDFPHEHGFNGHSAGLYEPAIHVPMFFRGPGVDAGTFDVPVSLVDLAPTILGLAGDSNPPRAEGVSLLPALRHAPATALRGRTAVWAERRLSHYGDELPQPCRATILGDLKLLIGETPTRLEAYDLLADGAEKRNLFLSDASAAAAIRERGLTELRRRVSRHAAAVAARAPALVVDEADEQRVADIARGADPEARRAAIRTLSSAPRPALAPLYRELGVDPDAEVRAWAAVGLGRVTPPLGAWPAEAALLGPTSAARESALDILIVSPCPEAADALVKVAGDSVDLRDWKPVAALNAVGHYRGLEILRETAMTASVSKDGLYEVIRRMGTRPRPGTPATLDLLQRRFGDNLTVSACVMHAASCVPSGQSLRLLESLAQHANPECAADARTRHGQVADAVRECRRRLNDGAADSSSDWFLGPFNAAWELAPGVSFCRPPVGALDDAGWGDLYPTLPVRRAAKAEISVLADAPAEATHGELAWASLTGGGLTVAIAGMPDVSADFSPGPSRLRFPLPSPRPPRLRVTWRLSRVSPAVVGWRELVFLPVSN